MQMRAESARQVTRGVQVVRGYKGIAGGLRVSVDCVRDMVVAGAPIVMDAGMPRAEMAELWFWYAEWVRRGKPMAENPVNPPLRPDLPGFDTF